MDFDHLHYVQSLDAKTGGGLTTSCCEMVGAQNANNVNAKVISSSSELSKMSNIPYVNAFHRSWENPFLYTKGMFGATKEIDARYVHAHGLYMYSSYLAGLHKKIHGSKLMVHVHGSFEPTMLARSKWKKAIVNTLFENNKYKTAEYWRALTLREADLIRNFGIKGEVFVLPNGIDITPIDSYLSSNLERPKKQRKTILYLGRLHKTKGILDFVKSWLALPDHQKVDWCLKIVGPDAGVLSLIKKLCMDDDSVIIERAAFGTDKYTLLSNADVFVLPSFSEGFSMAILEAMVFSLPVLITNACNFEESYEHGALQLPKEPNQWGKTIASIVTMDESELKQRGIELRRLVESKYTWSQIVSELENFLCDE